MHVFGLDRPLCNEQILCVYLVELERCLVCENDRNVILQNNGRDLVYLYQVPSQTSVKFRAGLYIQGVPGGMCQTSGECSLGQTIPI